MIRITGRERRSLLDLCPVSPYVGVLFSFVSNSNAFSAFVEHALPLKVHCTDGLFSLLCTTKHRPHKTLLQDSKELFVGLLFSAFPRLGDKLTFPSRDCAARS